MSPAREWSRAESPPERRVLGQQRPLPAGAESGPDLDPEGGGGCESPCGLPSRHSCALLCPGFGNLELGDLFPLPTLRALRRWGAPIFPSPTPSSIKRSSLAALGRCLAGLSGPQSLLGLLLSRSKWKQQRQPPELKRLPSLQERKEGGEVGGTRSQGGPLVAGSVGHGPGDPGGASALGVRQAPGEGLERSGHGLLLTVSAS